MAFGDASPNPNLSIDQVDVLSSQMRPHGIEWITYDYFGENLGRPGATTASSPSSKRTSSSS